MENGLQRNQATQLIGLSATKRIRPGCGMMKSRLLNGAILGERSQPITANSLNLIHHHISGLA